MVKYFVGILVFSVFIFAQSDALVVGVGRYENGQNGLGGIHYDIENIQTILHTLNVKKENIQILEDGQATLEGVRKSFYNYINSEKNHKDNIFIFYYSGHGLQIVDESGDEDDHWDEATALYDISGKNVETISVLDKKIEVVIIDNGVLLDDELYSILSKIKSKKIMIFDKCHSDSSTRGIEMSFTKGLKQKFILSPSFSAKIDVLPKAEKMLENYISLSATKDNELAEDSPLGGLFTESLLQAIVYKKASSHKGALTLGALENFCKINIGILAGQYKQMYKKPYKGKFTPVFKPVKYLDRSLNELFEVSPDAYEEATRPYLLEDTLDKLATKDILEVNLLEDTKEYKLNHSVSFEFLSKKEGYLNVLLVYKDSYKLFMNNRKIKAKKNYVFPDDFYEHKTLRAIRPLGKTKVFFILSREPWDIEKNIRTLKSDDLDFVHSLSNELMPRIGYEKFRTRDMLVVKKLKEPNLLTVSKIEFKTVKKSK